MIEIDGAFGEGGGQIIRTALSLSALTGKPFEVRNVRANRARPGLQPQHAMSVRAAATLCSATVEGAEAGSSRFRFIPGGRTQPSPERRFDIGTAGAAPLVAQTLVLPLSLAAGDSRLVITGGTHVPHAPTADYLDAAYFAMLRRAGFRGTAEYEPAGFYPRGGGILRAAVGAAESLSPIRAQERGELISLTAFIVTCRLPGHVADRGAATIEKLMKSTGRSVRIEKREEGELARGAGAAVTLVAECEGGFAGFTRLGERGLPMERVSESVCEQFRRWYETGAAVDEHLADQLALPAAAAPGESVWTAPVATRHLRTALWLIRLFVDLEWSIEETGDSPVRIRVASAGLQR